MNSADRNDNEAEVNVIIEQFGGAFGVSVRYELDTHVVNFFAAKVLGMDQGGSPLYWRKGSDSSTDPTNSLDDSERYLGGSVKWDGCSHVNFGDEDGYLHCCGVTDMHQVGQVLRAIHLRCGSLMEARGTTLLEGAFILPESAIVQ